MTNLPWLDGHYKCTNMYSDTILVTGNIANMLGFDPPPTLTAGDFGKVTMPHSFHFGAVKILYYT